MEKLVRVCVVRLNPDIRAGKPYSSYPTAKEYSEIHNSSPMNGFEEGVNFLAEDGIIRGYLPPKHAISIRDGKPFILITITAKTAKQGGDLIIGIQFNCKYLGEKTRLNLKDKNKSLSWHYSCYENDSFIFDKPLINARQIILGENVSWHRIPLIELDDFEGMRVLNFILSQINNTNKKEMESLVHLNFNDIEEDEVGLSNEDLSKIRLHKRVERDRNIIKKVKQLKGYTCKICDINLENKYGEIGKGYIEAHHIKPVSKIKGTVVIRDLRDLKNDFAVLCPNCHRMIHRSKNIEDIEIFKMKYLGI